jgi:hypothetical protein
MILYIILSYLVMLGMIMGEFEDNESVSTYAWVAWVFSPFVLPMIIGMMLVNKEEE